MATILGCGPPCPLCHRTFRNNRARTKHIRTQHPTANQITPSPTSSEPDDSAIDSDENNSPLHSNRSTHSNLSENGGAGDLQPPSPFLRVDNDLPAEGDSELDEHHANQEGAHRTSFNFKFRAQGRPCDRHGNFLPPGTPPEPRTANPIDDYSPFQDQEGFLLAEFLYRKVEMSSHDVDYLMEIWKSTLRKHGERSPFADIKDLHSTIDSITQGDVPWECLAFEPLPDLPLDAPDYERETYRLWYRNPDACISHFLLDNPELVDHFDTTPYIFLDASGDSQNQQDMMYENDLSLADSMNITIILGSDKTTVSVATGNVEYHPLADRRYDTSAHFRTFKRKLYHTQYSAVLQPVKPGMTKPMIKRCPDGHYRRSLYDLGPKILDYPEQVSVACIVQNWCPRCDAPPEDLDGDANTIRRTRLWTDELIAGLDPDVLWTQYGIDHDVVPFTNDFPHADIHEMISCDILHQLIKGTFHDHLVQWVIEYLKIEYGSARAKEILDDIDRRIAAAPYFPGLRRFPHGRRFKQWTGDDSKALMKVFVPAIVEYVPMQMTWCLRAFLDFCYMVRQNEVSQGDIDTIRSKLSDFHRDRKVFLEAGVRDNLSLPRQHSMSHYPYNIEEFGALSGLCSSITESRHITAKPWRRSNRYNALGQMLITNQRLDKLSAARTDFTAHGMLPPLYPPPPTRLRDPTLDVQDEHEDGDEGPVSGGRVMGAVKLPRRACSGYPRFVKDLATRIGVSHFPNLVRRFLYYQLHPDSGHEPVSDEELPDISRTRIRIFHSATATYYAPSDVSGLQGMRREIIRSTPAWRRGPERRDTVFLVEDEDEGMRGMAVARVRLLFSFKHRNIMYPCALVDRYTKSERPDAATGMWKAEPEFEGTSRSVRRMQTVEHLDTVYRAAHLMPVFGDGPLPIRFDFRDSLDAFTSFYVNKYVDHHAHEIAF
ncbi:hypothetical protein K488DRAFT_78514 [Vararia minispora EC-137]|uniref:Uncharacterized protein n=1 Tax=Vararia minispora EC-137 TaxID=1314806 RepID=A0ACB8QLX4_9AGAM|nr:hypothetical protein K488DRAFT_78514 [Vararia minispora EC-137]